MAPKLHTAGFHAFSAAFGPLKSASDSRAQGTRSS